MDALQKHKSDSQRVDQMVSEEIARNHQTVFWGDRMLTLDKSAGFLTDPQFAEAFAAIRGSHEYDQYLSPNSISWRLHTLVWAARAGLSIDGDFVECGVFKGDMAWVLCRTADLRSAGKQFYLYDTFDGFSDKYSSPEDFPDNADFYDFANNIYKDPTLHAQVCAKFREDPYVRIIKGTVPDVLRESAPQRIAFLHIDLNSPAAEIGALEVLFPRLSAGAVIVFDDYGWKQFRRQKEAEDRFMKQHGYEILELPTGQGLVVKR